MKFQNSSIHGFKLCYASKSVTNGRTDGLKDGQTDGRTTQKQYAPPTSLKLGA